MEKQKYKDEELKTKIFDIYTKYHEKPDRQKSLLQLWSLTCIWCKNYLFYEEKHLFYEETEEIEMEILKAVNRCTNKNKMSKEDFIPYLYRSLINAKKQYIRDHIKKGFLKETRTLKKIRKNIIILEKKLGREPTQDEKYNFIRMVMPEIKKEKTIRDYLTSIESTKIKLITNSSIDNDGKELNILDKIESHYSTYEEEFMDDDIANIIKDEFEKFINKQQDRMIPFYREIYTLYCVKTIKDYRKLRPILNTEILEICEKGGKLPAQYEIYMKYHNGKKSTAETNASSMSKKFIDDFKEISIKAIRDKYPKIKF